MIFEGFVLVPTNSYVVVVDPRALFCTVVSIFLSITNSPDSPLVCSILEVEVITFSPSFDSVIVSVIFVSSAEGVFII